MKGAADQGSSTAPREEKSAGLVRVFIGDTKLPSVEKVRREALCAVAMVAATHKVDLRRDGAW